MVSRPLLWLLVVPFFAVSGSVWAAVHQLEISGAAGLVASLCAALVGGLWLRSISGQADALHASARAARHELEPGDGQGDDPRSLARGIDALAQKSRELSRQLGTLTALVDGMSEGLWITDPSGTVVRHNDALKQMLWTGRELVGQRPLTVLRDEKLQEAVDLACRGSSPTSLELQVEGVRPRQLLVRVTPLREVGGSAAVFHDVTELRRLEKVRKDFVANVSHELRTPITAIRGYAETLKTGALADHQNAPRMVDIIHRQSERLSELVEDLLELSRLESQELQLSAQPVEVATVVARAADTVRPKADARSITLSLEVAAGLLARADERAVEQVVLNLLDNAVKYTQPGGRVWVEARQEGAACALAVRDTGLGIEARHLPRIFERFYRVDKGRSRDMGGTGLGLTIVKHLVSSMKGEVSVESTPGQGSTFRVVLPAEPP